MVDIIDYGRRPYAHAGMEPLMEPRLRLQGSRHHRRKESHTVGASLAASLLDGRPAVAVGGFEVGRCAAGRAFAAALAVAADLALGLLAAGLALAAGLLAAGLFAAGLLAAGLLAAGR